MVWGYNVRRFILLYLSAFFSLGFAVARGQLLATDDFEGYAGSPVGVWGGAGDWTGPWAFNTQTNGGAFLSADSKISGAKSIGLFGSGGTSGTSVSRPFPACTNELTIQASLRADYNVNSTNTPANARRMAFTIRSGNDASHFANQRLSFFFAAGTTNFQWFDGTDRATNAVYFVSNNVYDLRAVLHPTSRVYAFSISNRNNGLAFAYTGAWTTGSAGDPIGSAAFLMRGPNIAGSDAFLDSVSVSAPDYVAPLPQALPIREGDAWRFYKGTSTPPLQGTNQWYRPEYNDSAWSGPAPSGFGYDDCDDTTVLGDMLNNYISVFTRKTFWVTNPAAISRLTLAADYDDGLIAYLNGIEIARLNMPTSAVTRHTAASGNHESSRGNGAAPPNEKEFYAIDPALLVAGANVLAVQGHNVSTNSSDFSLIVELYTNTTLVRGPFIQMPRAGNTAAIAWRTAALADSVVEYGLDLTYAGGVVSNAGARRDHTAHLDNLLPGTTYFYRVRGNGETLAEGLSFRTRPASDQPFRFVVIGDHGQGTEWMSNIAHRINARMDFDAMMTVGDNIYGTIPCSLDGAPGWYDPYWFALYATTMARVATFPALGNHDWDTASGQYMVDYFRLPTNGPANHIGKNYSFEFGNMHVAVVDTEPYDDNNTSAMAEINAWLDADLASATQRWRIVLLHRPPFTTKGSHDDHPRVKSNIVPILKARGVHLVFQGHNHWYERINPIDGTHYITTAGGGAWLYASDPRKEYSAALYNARHSYTFVDVQGGRMTLQQINDQGVLIDEFAMDRDHPFAIDGLLDNAAWQRAVNGLKLHAAIRGHHLYVATQDAGEGSDHFIYLANTASTQRPANWAKSGTIMQWSAFLADENDGAFHGWFDANGAPLSNFNTYKSITSGLNNNGTNANGVLEGSIDLAAHFGSFPQQILLAAAPYGTTNGAPLVVASQVPAGNGNGHIESDEFLVLLTRNIALDLPIAMIVSNAPVEAGMPVSLDGSLSASPSGLPLSHAWSLAGGPPGSFSATNGALTAFRLTQQVAGVETAIVTLAVHDGRFTESTNALLRFFPMVDSDGDGLSDQEELTGADNILTGPNPNGHITNPFAVDSDGDGVSDGDEAIAGTDPNNSASKFELVGLEAQTPSGLLVRWSSATGRLYHVRAGTNLLAPWLLIVTNVPATPPMNAYTASAPADASRLFSVEVESP